jgi:GNAT superfamily N-acetyltransferase
MVALPPGFVARPLADADVDAVVALVRACEVHDSGVAAYERADLVGDLATVLRERDSLVVRSAADPREPVAWGVVVHGRSRWADVRPDMRGRGLGGALVEWSVDVARATGADRIGQTIEDGRTDAESLFRSAGAVAVRTAWVLRLAHDPTGPRPVRVDAQPPTGVILRTSTEADEIEALDMMELAFSEWPDRRPSSRATWQALVTQREGFQHDQLQVAVDSDGTIVGAAFLIDDGTELWVDKLATHPQHRGRGIGRALLAHAFGIAHDRGRASTALSTDSNTGALPFYERLGMSVTRSFTHWAIPLDGHDRPPDAERAPGSDPPA